MATRSRLACYELPVQWFHTQVESWKSSSGKKKTHFLEGGYSAAAGAHDTDVP